MLLILLFIQQLKKGIRNINKRKWIKMYNIDVIDVFLNYIIY